MHPTTNTMHVQRIMFYSVYSFLLHVLLLTERVLFKWKMLIYSELQRHNGDWQMFPSISPLIEKFSSCGYSVCEEISVCLYFFSSFLSVLIFYHWPLQFVKKLSCSCSFCWLSNILLPVCLYPYPRSSVVVFFRSLFLSFIDSLLFFSRDIFIFALEREVALKRPCLSFLHKVCRSKKQPFLFWSGDEKTNIFTRKTETLSVSVYLCVCFIEKRVTQQKPTSSFTKQRLNSTRLKADREMDYRTANIGLILIILSYHYMVCFLNHSLVPT